MDLKVNKVSGLRGKVKIPGDKSISHRAAIIGSLAKGKTLAKNFLFSGDCLSTLRCLEQLGVKFDQPNKNSLIIEGVGLRGFSEPLDVLNVGNSGTTLRILPGILAGQDFFSVLTGDQSARKRPMKRVAEPLKMMGAKIWLRGGDFAPIALLGSPLNGITYLMPVASAQVKTSLLLAGLIARGKTKIIEKVKSRNHTEKMLKLFGASLEEEVEENSITIKGETDLKGVEIDIPNDLSAAAFFIVGALITPSSEITIDNLGINPTRMGIIEVLLKMGAQIEILEERTISEEPRANLLVKTSNLKGVRISDNLIPKLIDEIPIIAIAASQAEGETLIEGAKELRVKETDRIRAITTELKKMGVWVDEFEDGFSIKGPNKLKGARVKSYGDHRMAMALAVAGLVAEGETVIEEADCINISFPSFKEELERACQF